MVQNRFHSPLFDFTYKNFNVKRKEFCYAGVLDIQGKLRHRRSDEAVISQSLIKTFIKTCKNLFGIWQSEPIVNPIIVSIRAIIYRLAAFLKSKRLHIVCFAIGLKQVGISQI